MAIGGNSPDNSKYFNMQRPGVNAVGSYQVSGYPFVTGSMLSDDDLVKISFPGVVKSFTAACHTPTKYIKIYFKNPSDNAVINQAHNWLTVSGSSGATVAPTRETMDVKCNELYVVNDSGATIEFELQASVTGIDPSSMFTLSGSGINV